MNPFGWCTRERERRMSELEKALKIYGDPDSYIGHERAILDAARRFANLTSDETIEKAARARYEHHRGLLVAAAEKHDKLMILPEWDELPEDDRQHRGREAELMLRAVSEEDR